MIRSKRQVNLERKLYGIRIEDISVEDAVCSAAYLFLIALKEKNSTVAYVSEFYDLMEKLAGRLGLLERMHLVFQKYVSLLEKNKVLHLYVDPEMNEKQEVKKNIVIVRRRGMESVLNSSDYKYEEDMGIERSVGLQNENKMNFHRLMYAEGKGIVAQALYYIFFCKAKINASQTHEKLPKSIERILCDTSRVDFIKNELSLSEEEARYLLFRYRKLAVSQLAETLDLFSLNSLELYTTVLGITKKQFNQITRSDSKLRQYGFIADDRSINPVIADVIENRDLNIYFSDCIRKQDLKDTYSLNSFSVPEKNTLIYKDLMQSDEPVSLLLYGAPGSGKTEYAKALAKSSGKKAIIFKNESEVLEKEDVLARLNCLLSLNRKDTVLIVDEADSLLSTSMVSMLGPVLSQQKKGVVNKMLELSQNKVIWIVNHKFQMDESTLRRFTVSYKFDAMSVSMLEKITSRKLEKIELAAEIKKEILQLFSKYKVTGASVENLIKTINSMKSRDGEKILENLEIVLKDNSALLHGESKIRKHVKDSYDMTVLNTSIPAKKIMEMLYNAKRFGEKNPGSGAVRMLFYGLSGTGKTEFARYISESLGKELLLKRASDIFDKYVGGTEQNIASAFEEAARNNQVLLFDEADSFFSDRKNAERNFERTQVNEFLTQLEEFPGIVICTTNLRNIMDPAMLRRFHITVDFKALDEQGIEKLLRKFFKEHEFEGKLIRELCEYETVTPGDFGRLADIIKFMDPEEVTAEYIIRQLCCIQEEKNGSGKKSRNIGFCACA